MSPAPGGGVKVQYSGMYPGWVGVFPGKFSISHPPNRKSLCPFSRKITVFMLRLDPCSKRMPWNELSAWIFQNFSKNMVLNVAEMHEFCCPCLDISFFLTKCCTKIAYVLCKRRNCTLYRKSLCPKILNSFPVALLTAFLCSSFVTRALSCMLTTYFWDIFSD